jgi:NADPH:quinone reductase-like Zn-dependent oxidoreductase/acyl transferase domain-containing protein
MSVAYYRGLLSSRLANDKNSQGGMLSAGTSETEIQPYLKSIEAEFGYLGVSIGCTNSPHNVTITGDELQIDYLKTMLDKDGVFARKLAVSVAYHSSHMKAIAVEYSKAMGKLCQRNGASSIKMVSSVTGGVVAHSQLSQKGYWVQNMVSPIRFMEALTGAASVRILENNQTVHDKTQLQFEDILEIGPHSALQGPIKDTLKMVSKNTAAGYVSALVRNANAVNTLFGALGYLHCRGHRISVKAVNNLNSPTSSLPAPLTNLPEYPFDHSRSYWRESRVSKGHRFREAPRNDFLGMRVPDWNPQEAKWRRRLKLSEDPWIEDHTIAKVNILPAAAMIVMAVEGAKSVARSRAGRAIAGYTLKDILFSRALAIAPDSDGTEVEFHLRSSGQAADRENSWSDFRLYCIENDAWVEACRGNIRVSYVEDCGQVDKGLEAQKEAERHATELSRIGASCSRVVDMELIYRSLAESGIDFGPAHQVIKACAYNEDLECFGEIDANQWKVKSRKYQQTDFTIHPTSLDGLFQLGLVAMTEGGTNISPSVVSGIRRLWIAEGEKTGQDHSRMLVWNKSAFTGLGNTISTAVALDASGQKPVIVVDGLAGKFLKEHNASSDSQKGRRLCWNFDYRPDIDLLTQDELHKEVTTTFPIQPSPFKLDHDIKLLLYLCILRTLRQLTPSDITKLATYHQKYLTWMEREKEKLYSDGSTNGGVDFKQYVDDDAFYDQLLNRLENENKRGKFFAVLARNLYGILRGNHDALELMFQTPLVKDYYRELYKATNGLSKALAFLNLYAHKHPDIKILEIGAGTGGMTKYILDTLTQNGSGVPGAGAPRFAHYTYTDISAGFFSDASSMFENFSDKATFAVLDIEKDPVLQGFEEGAYDLIIADNVFHATQNLDTTVKHARKLLKPGGKLALFELTDPEVVRTNFAFGLLPGWWRHSDTYRHLSAGVSDSAWDCILKKGGLSGVDLNLHDYDDPVCHEHSALISTAKVDISDHVQPPRTLIVFDGACSLQKKVCEELSMALKNSGVQETVALPMEEAVNLSDLGQWFCIVILELGDSILRGMNESQYQDIKTLLQADGGILWVCRGGGARPELPDHALIQGAFRGLRMEERASKFISLSLEATSTDPLYVTRRINQIFHTVATRPVNACEQEYVERDGNICIDRFIEADYLNQALATLMEDTQSGESRFDDNQALTLSIASPGLLDTLEFVEDESAKLELAPDEIEIKVEASGVNFRDCLIALGRIPGNSFGFECSGTVCRKGCEVYDLEVGNRVCASAIGTYQTYSRCKASDAILMQDSMSFVEAATLPVVFTTAFYSLVHVANIQRGESVLIHSAAGGTGQAAIQVAKLFEAEIFATVGSDEKKSLLMASYQIPEDHIFDSRNTSFVKGIERMTADKGGVNIILNSLSGDFLVESWQCVAPFGRFLELGKKDILANGNLPMLPFSKNASFHAIDLNEARKYQPALLQRLRNDIMSLLGESKICPPQPIHVYGVGEVEKAFRYLQSGKNTGKTVIEMRRDDLVKVRTT